MELGDPHIRRHDGFFLRLALGAGILMASASSLTIEGDVSGSAVLSEAALGATVWNGLVIGGNVLYQAVPSPTYEAGGAESSGGALAVMVMGPFVDWYFDPQSGLHAGLTLGLAVGAAAKGSESPPVPPEDVSGLGYGVSAEVGYDWWVGEQWSLGVLLRGTYTFTKLDGLTYVEDDGSGFTMTRPDTLDTTASTIGLMSAATYH